MKIAMVTPFYKKGSGVGGSVAELAERFAKEHNVHIFAGSVESLCTELIFHKVPMLSISSLLKELSFFVMSAVMLKRERFDIINLHYRPTAVSVDVVTNRGTPRAFLEILKTISTDQAPELPKRLVFGLNLMSILYDYPYKRGRHKKVIALSDMSKKETVKLYKIPEENIAVIPNGVDIEEFNPENRQRFRRQVREELRLKDSDFVFLFVGSHYRRKGLSVALEALSKIKMDDIKLVVVGRERLELEFFLQRVKELGIERNVIFVGEVTTGVKPYYAASDAFLFPTLYEPFGKVITEAMASGLPIITTRRAGAAELIHDGVSGLLIEDPLETDDIVEKMKRLISDDRLRTGLSIEARKSAEKLSWDKIAENTLSIYRSVIDRKQSE